MKSIEVGKTDVMWESRNRGGMGRSPEGGVRHTGGQQQLDKLDRRKLEDGAPKIGREWKGGKQPSQDNIMEACFLTTCLLRLERCSVVQDTALTLIPKLM